MIEDILTPFFTTKDTGTGLDLSIADQIAAEHGGFIAVASDEGRGSSFSVNLPIMAAEASTDDEEQEPLLTARYGRMGKI